MYGKPLSCFTRFAFCPQNKWFHCGSDKTRSHSSDTQTQQTRPLAIRLYFPLSFGDRMKSTEVSCDPRHFAPTPANTPRLFRRVLCEHRHTMTHTMTVSTAWQGLCSGTNYIHIRHSPIIVLSGAAWFLFLVWDLYPRRTRHHFSQPQCLPLCLLMAGMECSSAPLVPTGK